MKKYLNSARIKSLLNDSELVEFIKVYMESDYSYQDINEILINMFDVNRVPTSNEIAYMVVYFE
jgi:hypothetical protein